MEISRTAVDRLQNIPWFVNIGRGGYLNDIKKITAESYFISHITSVDWEDVTLQAGNAINGYLSKRQSLKYHYWNGLVRKAKEIIDIEIIPIIKNPTTLDDDILINNVKWDLVSFLAEETYKAYLPNERFFKRLTVIYENGHIPCGWEGQWPFGRLVIY
ncbi:hypothetical protein DH20_11500 [Pantoea agglomerans]|nr:hypothetical protein [Pantoea agglomerans]